MDVIDYLTDLEGLQESGGTLAIHLSFDGVPVSVEPVHFNAEMLTQNEPAATWITTEAVTGQWRSTEVSYSANLSVQGWKVSNLAADRGNVIDVVIPYPKDVIFHPVVSDSSQIPSETQKLEQAFLSGDGFGIMDEWRQYVWQGPEDAEYPDGYWDATRKGNEPLYVYTPLVIGRHSIGSPVVIEEQTSNIRWTFAALDVLVREYRDGAFDWDRTYQDYRVAVVSNEVMGLQERHGGGSGVAYLGMPFVAMRLGLDNGRDHATVWTLIHEMAHCRGLQHIYDDPNYGARDLNYPAYPECNINVDAYRVGADGRVVTLRREDYFDFMGVGDGPEWISAYHYRKWAESGFGLLPSLEARRPIVDVLSAGE